jgi:EmrB/QacA subfamily drug resistance transporter
MAHPAPAGPSAGPLTHRQVLVIFSGLLLAMLLAALDSTIVATALPTIVGELGGLERLAWVVTAYLVAQTIVTPLYGKLGDLYGRKVVLQGGIVLFLIGSVLCGMSQSMGQLILFRFIQGLGGGGLMVTTMAVVGDVVPPRERGRYQGIFGAVFGVSSIAGPLLGGYFTTHWSWRWIFYINLPLGLVAMAVIAATLPARTERIRRAIDFAGAGLLAVTLSAAILAADLGGATYGWTSPVILGLAAASLVSLAAFIAVERRAAEPVLPLRLFRERSFSVSSAVGLIVGFAMFGSVTYLPVFLQVVNGASPTGSGLQMLPMMGGMLVSSITSGQLISRWGRYKMFPVIGTAVMATGLLLLSRMDADTTLTAASINMLVLGLGLGLVMQVLVIAVQNAVDYRDLGVATSGTTLFRLIGGSLGTAAFGAIFAAGLRARLMATLPPGASAGEGAGGLSPQVLAAMPPETRALYVDAFTGSLSTVFVAAAAIAAIGFLLALLIPEKPLRESVAATAGDVGTEAGEAFAMPQDADSVRQMERALALVASRDASREYVQRVTARAGVELSPAAAWLLVRLDEDPHLDPHALGRDGQVEPAVMDAALAELRDRGLVAGERGKAGLRPTQEGCAVLDRLADARRAHLTEVLSEWDDTRRGELAERVRQMSRDLVPDLPHHGI